MSILGEAGGGGGDAETAAGGKYEKKLFCSAQSYFATYYIFDISIMEIYVGEKRD